MSATRTDVARRIARIDPAFARVVRAAGPPPAHRPAPVGDRFAALVRSITSQLLTTRAAATIHERVVACCHGDVRESTVIELGTAPLREAGLSGTKARAIIELAHAVHDGRVRLARHGHLSDAEVSGELTRVHGIGPWTAQMYLMHTLARPDVWPSGDFGVRHGWSVVHRLNELITETDLRPRGVPFDGVRSSVAWYCWQAVDIERAE
ncbi:MAG: DNA-3-methyladenine glycosylase family protein [Acidimicrobiales bacterium]